MKFFKTACCLVGFLASVSTDAHPDEVASTGKTHYFKKSLSKPLLRTSFDIKESNRCKWNEVYVHEKCVPRECVYEGVECNSRGVCQQGHGDSYRCHCDDDMHYLPDWGCVPTPCIGDTPIPCQGGICSEVLAGLYACECLPGMVFAGYCAIPTCIQHPEQGVCSRVGVCADTCQCPPLHAGDYCEMCTNDAQMVGGKCISHACIDTSGLVCSGRGICAGVNPNFYCACNENYIAINSSTCVHRNCIDASYEPLVCHGHGECIDNRCSCDDQWWGSFCERPAEPCMPTEVFVDGSCFPRSCVVENSICNTHGDCIGGVCHCYTYASAHSTLLCYPTTCLFDRNGYMVPCPHGQCTYESQMLGYQCRCYNGYVKIDKECQPSYCVSDIYQSKASLCGGVGFCDLDHGCLCPQSITGRYCTLTTFATTLSRQFPRLNIFALCEDGFLLINGSCVSKACLTGEKEVCYGDRGYCVHTQRYGWGCRCYSHYTGPTCSVCSSKGVMINGQCIPALCTVLLSSGDYVECGGHGVCNISTQPNDSSDPMEVIVCVCDDLSYPIEKTCISKTCITTSPFLKSDFRIICSGHGVCEIDSCLCFGEYTGPECSYRNDLICVDGYQPIDGKCVPSECVYIDTICGGHGECISFESGSNSCKCYEGFSLTSIYGCQPTVCVNSEGLLCKDGTCVQISPNAYECQCQEEYAASHGECHPRECVDWNGNLCNTDRGRCIYDTRFSSFRCECLDGYSGVFCAQCSNYAVRINGVCVPPQCYIDDGNNVHICGGFGTCIYQYKKASYCVCDDGAAVQANGQCASWACVQPGLVTNMACSGFGICANERCICNSIFYGTYCEKVQPNCGPAQIFIKSKEECIPLVCVSNETICNDHGECIRGETTNGVVRAFCQCSPGYALYNNTLCVPPGCIIHGELCPDGHCTNDLIAPCICDDNYTWTGVECTPNICLNGKDMYGKYIICSARGSCDSKQGCNCLSIYEGKLCEECGRQGLVINGTCFPSHCVQVSNGTYTICNNYGSCERSFLGNSEDTYRCACRLPSVDIKDGGCYSPLCIPDPISRLVCNGHGFCDGGHCICQKGYKGRRCEHKS
ncbi:Neurogenic locus notch-like protein [Giardia duodenalis]|uniref:Neurogenic locus notch-like protein n=1 Tax=Giardia intestinalis (strain ATCC 50803 / WB clone C6) TaxID=184922 RepID=A8BVL6_GIAIC|nr:Neurogenic locus notch-like protein [Giardia intestinalis]KAE8304513.1 Neurogenic locus notch-like protein [Giardia intestinalis]|eukprot:XP_001704579.1 Neurogenic locus notch-like protein [Giardia lamblia ATCC 50803]